MTMFRLSSILNTLVFLSALPLSAAYAYTPADRMEIARGLVAQADIGRIVRRERRFADDRELALVTEDTLKIGALRSKLLGLASAAVQQHALTAKQEAARKAAETDLVKARSDLAGLAETLARRDVEWSAEREAFRAETQQMVAAATPEKLAALQLFADGDRVKAWPILEEIADATVRSGLAAANARAAVTVRQLAAQREIMLDHGEATAADALSVEERAAKLDPADFYTQLRISRLAEILGQPGLALTAARSALAESSKSSAIGDSSFSRSIALQQMGNLQTSQNDFVAARQSLDESVRLARTIVIKYPVVEYPGQFGPQRNMFYTLISLGEFQEHAGDFKSAISSYSEGMSVIETLHEGDPENIEWLTYLADGRQRLCVSQRDIGELLAALNSCQKAATGNQEILLHDPNNMKIKRSLSGDFAQTGSVYLSIKNYNAAILELGKSSKLAREIRLTDPSNMEYKLFEAAVTKKMAETQYYLNENAAAMHMFSSVLSESNTMLTQNPLSTDVRQRIYLCHLYMGTMQRMANNLEESRNSLDAALADATALVKLAPLNSEYRENLSFIKQQLEKDGSIAPSAKP